MVSWITSVLAGAPGWGRQPAQGRPAARGARCPCSHTMAVSATEMRLCTWETHSLHLWGFRSCFLQMPSPPLVFLGAGVLFCFQSSLHISPHLPAPPPGLLWDVHLTRLTK